jgi:hypothetical protein
MLLTPLLLRHLIFVGIVNSLSLIVSTTVSAAYWCDHENLVGIYPAPFTGKPWLAAQVSTMVGTELLASLRSADPDEAGSDFGHGLVEPRGDELPKCSQLLLHGKVLPLGKDALFFATLRRFENNDRRKKRPELWKIDVADQSVTFDVIRDEYVFSPTKIGAQIKANYTTVHELRLCNAARLPCTNGIVGNATIKGEDIVGSFLEVQLSDGRGGWLYLPAITKGNPVVNFSAAIVRLERGDFSGAANFLTAVIQEGSEVDTGLRVNALLLRAAAMELSGRDGGADVSMAEALAPGQRYVIQISVMTKLNHLIKLAAGAQRDKMLAEVRAQLDHAEKILPPSDSWFLSARKATANLS